MRSDESELKQEVVELTDLLRTHPALEAVRQVLIEKGHDPYKAILAGLIEGESCDQRGVVVVASNVVIQFVHRAGTKKIRAIYRQPSVYPAIAKIHPAFLIALRLAAGRRD